jgi:hypothetical protein
MNITEDFSSNLEITPRCIHVKGLAQGKYTLYFTSAEGGLEQIQCTVIDNKVDFSKQDFWSQWVVGTDMCAKQDGKLLQKPLLLTSDGVSNETVRLHIENASPKAFVVVTLTTFVATRDETLSNWLLGQRFLTRPLPQENGIQSTRSIFLDDKRIGEEYQYILNRARSEQWVGSNLTKPSLLVYPKVKYTSFSLHSLFFHLILSYFIEKSLN